MKKNIMLRGLIGFPAGITICYLITIILSVCFANGYYAPCVPELITLTGSEINAVILQALLGGLLGAGFGACSVIWEKDNWGIVKQTGIYFLLISVIMMPTAYFTYWMEHSVRGFFSYFGIFALIFIIIWIIEFIIGRRNVNRMNEVLQKKKCD